MRTLSFLLLSFNNSKEREEGFKIIYSASLDKVMSLFRALYNLVIALFVNK